MEKEYIEVKGEKIPIYIQRKNIKNINLKINKEKQIIITMPKKVAVQRAKDFAIKKIKWIKNKQNFYEQISEKREKETIETGGQLYILGKKHTIKVNSSKRNEIIINDQEIELYIKEKYIENKEYIKKYYEKWLKEYARIMYQKTVIKFQKELEKYNIKIPQIEIKKMKSKWGSCIPSQNKIILNLSLIKTPINSIEYVILHELSHFRYQNHSKNFYNFISIFMPDWKERRKILNEFICIV